MTQNSPTESSSSASSSSSSCHPRENSRSGIHCVAGRAVAPMPSLTSHPPVQQIKPQTQLAHRASYGMQRSSPPLLPPRQSRTSSPTSSPASSPGPSHSSQLQDFPCSHCNQVYKKVGHLNRHVLTHSGTRFRCDVKSCDKTFSRLDNMRTHVKNMHPGAS